MIISNSLLECLMKLLLVASIVIGVVLGFPVCSFAATPKTATVIVDKRTLSDTERTQLLIYMMRCNRRIKRAWFPPRDGGAVTVRFQVNNDGVLQRLRAFPESNCKICDQAALKAVENAAPFGPLPPGCSSIDVTYLFDYNVFSPQRENFKILVAGEKPKPGAYLIPSDCSEEKNK